ncbi:hypothetical protein OH799_07415 [Nocardia sp. NBC_00881]|uniref:hypothetical protein n=1 Tax=Nocardia sp. NBC_00881 TaxID=2975995 RepID=UPI003869539A|nr:hypothetical protein OH799_07415 [Nocardia sp. NBC_00881]
MSGSSSSPEPQAPFALALSLAGAVTSQAFLFTAVLYYFGWAYAHAWFAYFGVDVGMLGLSVADYTLRSLTGAFWPVVIALLGLLVLASARRLPLVIAVRTRRPRQNLRRWYVVVLIVGTALSATPGITWMVDRTVGPPLSTYLPGFLVVGAMLLGHAITLRSSCPALIGSGRTARRNTPRPAPTGVLVVLLALGFAGTIWGIGAYADRQATTDARNLAQSRFPGRPSILVLSVDRLGIEGTGTQVNEFTVPGEKYRYVYSGLRMLARTPDTYFLVPQQWELNRDRVFVVPRTDSLRIDIDRHA